ncbi:hypothetical protein T11_5087, partial [Trichinella zimbabwensis]
LEMGSKENHQETLYEIALEKLKLDDHQLDVHEKQVKPNEGLEETKQDEQAMETDAENNANDVIENDNELSVTGSGECSMGDAECDININADMVNEGVLEGSADVNGQSRSRDEVPKQYDAEYEITNEQTNENLDTAENGVLSDEIHGDCVRCHINRAILLLRIMRQILSIMKLFVQFLEIRFDLS